MNYIRTYFISFILIVGTISLINWFIDPFGMFWSPQISGINATKTEAGKRSRITKAYQVKSVAPQVLIVGNSRVEMGLDPSSPIFKGKNVYNQGMPGAHIVMQVDYALDAIVNTPSIEHVVMSVDFLDFLLPASQKSAHLAAMEEKVQSSYRFRLSSHEKEKNAFLIAKMKENMGLVFSLDALSASIKTISKQTTLSSSINSHGFNSATSYRGIMKTEGIKPLFTQKLNEISARLESPMVIKAYSNFPYSPRFNHLGKLIQVAKARNIKLDFFINPYHFSYLHMLADKGQWSNFLLWKETLVNYLNNNTFKRHDIWDFSGLNSITKENVPTKTPKQLMKWFWEPAHYRKELGELILTTLMQGSTSQEYFGQKLTKKNIQRINLLENQKLEESAPQWHEIKTQLNF